MIELSELFWLRPIDGINILILLVLVWILYRVINDQGNLIVWADYISSVAADGKQRGDLNKIGQLVGIGIAFLTVMMYADNKTVDPTGLSALLGVSLLYLGSVSAYSANLRAKQGSVTTTKVTEPAPDPAVTKTTETKAETAPVRQPYAESQ